MATLFVVVGGWILSPAVAAQFYGNVQNTYASGGGGIFQGNIHFTALKSFNYNMTVEDYCDSNGNGDSAGVYVYFVLNVGNNNATYFTADKGWDTNQCGNGALPYSGTVNWPTKIKSARAIGELRDNGQPINTWPANTTTSNPYFS